MLLKVTFAALLLVVATTAAVIDENPMADLVLGNYFRMLNASGINGGT